MHLQQLDYSNIEHWILEISKLLIFMLDYF
jgi:hypothetical protein